MAEPKPKVMEWTQAAADVTPRAVRGEPGEYGWLMQQADLPRIGRLDALDRQPLADLPTDVAISEMRALGSAMRVPLQHMLKATAQPEKLWRSWLYTIAAQQDDAKA